MSLRRAKVSARWPKRNRTQPRRIPKQPNMSAEIFYICPQMFKTCVMLVHLRSV